MNDPIAELKTYPYIVARFDISEVPGGHPFFGEGPRIKLTERGAKPRGRGNTTPPSTALICRDGGKLSMTIRVPFHSALPSISGHDPVASLVTVSADTVTALFRECRKRGWLDDFTTEPEPVTPIKFLIPAEQKEVLDKQLGYVYAAINLQDGDPGAEFAKLALMLSRPDIEY